MQLQHVIIILLSRSFLDNQYQVISQEDTWFNASVWEDLGSGTYIDEDIWKDPDLVDWRTCSKVLDELLDDQDQDELHMDVLSLADSDVHRSGMAEQHLWPRGVIPTRLEPGMTIDEHKRIACAVTFFAENTCVRFVQLRPSDINYLTIKKTDRRSGCFSESLGVAGGEQIVNLDERKSHCWLHGTIIHELMHAIGFFHEQARNDRDSYIQVHWDDIADNWHKQFKKGLELGVRQQLVGSYDYNSVMHYKRLIGSRATMTALQAPVDENNDAMGNRKAPTAMDMAKINELYKCNDFHKDCMVSEWETVGPCEDGKQNIKRSILQNATGNGTQCPQLTGFLKCKEQICFPIDPKILIIGGRYAAARSSMELYHPFSSPLNNVINVSMMQERKYHASALMDDGTVISVGGKSDLDDSNYLSSCESFNPPTATVTQCPSLNTAWRLCASSVLQRCSSCLWW